jgi:hypothetical protein
MPLPRIACAALSSLALLALCACGGGGSTGSPPPVIHVTISGPTGLLDSGASRTFSASVSGTSNLAVTWSVVESGGGTVSAAGVYTAPAIPGTYTVKATSQADAAASATLPIPVIIPEGHIAGYDVGVDYHATGADFINTAFISQYDVPAVRQTVQAQLQGMADRGATLISTRIWPGLEPGSVNNNGAWIATFPLTLREQSNLHNFATDVAAVVGTGGNRLRLSLGLLWLGASDYRQGSPATTLGTSLITAGEYTRRVEATTDTIIAAVQGVSRPDGVPVVDIIYLNGELLIAAPADPDPHFQNTDWFMTALYPRFVQVVRAAGFTPSVYFIINGYQAQFLDPGYLDAVYPELNDHRSAYWLYRGLRFMQDHGLPIPARIDFSYYIADLPLAAGVTYPQLLARALDDADAVLPLLGIPTAYGVAETFYFPDATERRAFGQSFAAEAAAHSRLHLVTFWTTPDGGGTSVNNAYPFAIEDYLPPP